LDVLTKLSHKSEYSTAELQLIIAAWVVSSLFERRQKISTRDGDVSEDDYDKRSIYSLLYALYRSMGMVRSGAAQPWEFTFNTWGYAWPSDWAAPPSGSEDPQRFGRNAYSGLFQSAAVQNYVRERDGRVHVVEMGSGTGAGAHHVCRSVLPACTYEAVDMQQTAIETCKRKFVPELAGRLVATCADCTQMAVADNAADLVAVCETHVTEQAGRVTEEDRAFFAAARRVLKPGGFLVWGNAIPTSTWQPCFDLLADMGFRLVEQRDVTDLAVAARDQDQVRIDSYVELCLNRFMGFKIPGVGAQRRREAEVALKNFCRNPGTSMYQAMREKRDAYKVVVLEKAA
jgi:SAM-dependent methyltransferase